MDPERVVAGRRRFECQDCGRTFGETLGTPLFHLHTPLPEIIRAIRVVMRRGSLRAAEEQTRHNYATIGEWIRRIGDHAEAVSDVLVHDLELSEVEVDHIWSFVGKKGATPYQRGKSIHQRASTGNAGDA